MNECIYIYLTRLFYLCRWMDENDQLRDLVQGLERRLANRAPVEREAKAKERAQREVYICIHVYIHACACVCIYKYI